MPRSTAARAIFASAVTAGLMTVFECAKQTFHRDITVWESHLSTIVFSALVALGATALILRSQARLHDRAPRELQARTQTEQALQEGEQRLRTIMESIQAGIVIVDAETHLITDVNRAAAEMIGGPREEIVGRLCHRYICPAEQGRCPVTDSGEEVDATERVLLTANGARLPILKTVTRVTLDGRPHPGEFRGPHRAQAGRGGAPARDGQALLHDLRYGGGRRLRRRRRCRG
ncbi:MAG: hypothetical protein COZ06_28760 [Armatimonadetes bacterium CG_4_10_14_3_um_filter_66_18]|nr:PAS domain-containing protein [Armatimonadota bacterium]OIP05264.1 MAG: hypothetical protein AUJ96_11220 [Armatimonadetes bacterium CG2_30_66_41]PIU93916.1 MAG: hypothetical protein COS65_10380 [Armatimonadetes bacterium CG06_land_8_20_14_3_00_66_21]PIX46939.1 MAG: hypothetical protein COZ57_09905 [Armatimonadetes bacterium CG_4_8_14_3_um_filter_66_20]PIY39977.1 MAG: hypothetical protein COZ06_28760 [Armatimonadetes bacterium CG_4_10_14_3_um_filter_66_18]PIZ32948.1 MAG: hypothetical protein